MRTPSQYSVGAMSAMGEARRARGACVRTPTGADRGTNAADRLPMSCVLLAAAVVLWPSVARETNDERRDPWVSSQSIPMSRCPDP